MVLGYLPDFQIGENIFIEVKGYWDNDAMQKILRFHEIYKDVVLIIIDEKKYHLLRILFKEKVLWEGK